MLKILQFLLIVAAAFLLVANIEPYIAVTRLVFEGDGQNAINVCDQLRPIPFIGGLLGGGCELLGAFIYAISGFIVWAVFQIIELLPIANSFQIPFLSGVLAKMQAAPQVDENASDRKAVRHVKRKHNTIVERSLAALLTFAWVMYLVDLALMCWLYSPLNELGELNWMALVRVLLGVFGVELVILGLTLVNNVIDPKSIKFQTSDRQEIREY